MDKRQGQIWKVNCDPNKGSEPGKKRPCLIIQTDALNINRPSSYICLPLTTNVQENSLLRESIPRGYCGLTRDSTVLIDQLTAFDESRFMTVLGEGRKLPDDKLTTILEKVSTLFVKI